MQIIPSQATLDLVFAAKDDCFALALMAKKIFCEIKLCLREEFCLAHVATIDQRRITALTNHVTEIPDQRPEGGAILNRPTMQRLIIGKLPPCALLCLHAKMFKPARCNAICIRLPQWPIIGGSSLVHHSSQNYVS